MCSGLLQTHLIQACHLGLESGLELGLELPVELVRVRVGVRVRVRVRVRDAVRVRDRACSLDTGQVLIGEWS